MPEFFWIGNHLRWCPWWGWHLRNSFLLNKLVLVWQYSTMHSRQVWNALLQMKKGSLPFHDQFRCLNFRILESRLLPTVAPKTLSCGWLSWRIPASGSEEFEKIGLVFISWNVPWFTVKDLNFRDLLFFSRSKQAKHTLSTSIFLNANGAEPPQQELWKIRDLI